ncbi:phage head-tail adaptor, putative, SPP1 family [Aliiroseovarius sediminilitoris]|uniref:Phage head-tail adaptor, putative, SPP1 family n=1 Tax=Aliiroseovarius sediminilitoris TaxID=1173584 RepID=A0A1I0Q2B3_9RHOB|nr:phage head closure protein [Aliiroseovarius sediminilitoris]SEW20694.1 phage head-tail adaptor, putative, SPP1 family [Aliiroseovarius sediminilitoris]
MKRPVLNRKLTLEAPVRTPDGAGGFTQSWQAVGELWAEIKPRTGRERAAGLATVSTIAFRITVRAAPDGAPSRPEPDQRFRAGSRLFRILAVTEADVGAHYLTCFAQEEVSA